VIKKKDLSAEDKKVWEDYTSSPSNIYDKENQNNSINLRKKRFKFDLHGFTLDEANKKVKEIIFACIKKNYKEILFITGKGLHSNTDNNIELKNCVFSISEANIKNGGSGAILIKLKNL